MDRATPLIRSAAIGERDDDALCEGLRFLVHEFAT